MTDQNSSLRFPTLVQGRSEPTSPAAGAREPVVASARLRACGSGNGMFSCIFHRMLGGLCLLFFFPANVRAVEPVNAKLGKESAWTGEAVPLIITLYSPGPFAGTASFDLPDLPLTAFVRGGSPVVGSESIDGETYLTQQHELTIYTQRNGDIVIPAFRVRFAGKKTFISPAESMQGYTTELTFQSKRPPGTEQFGVVVAATGMETTQKWAPDPVSDLQPGDVIERTIVRRASGTTAMMMSPISATAPDGVRMYVADPTVQDRTERGTVTAERGDTIKYQFERAGTFTIPETTVVWWDPSSSKLEQKTLAGKIVSVAADVAVVAEPDELETGSAKTWSLLAIAASIGLVAALAGALIDGLKLRRKNPAALAERRLLAACRTSDAAKAYAAFLNWKKIVITGGNAARLEDWMRSDGAPLAREVAELSRQLFGENSAADTWSGESLATAFACTRNMLAREDRNSRSAASLPQLNPSAKHR